jgi:HEAT repeat protein
MRAFLSRLAPVYPGEGVPFALCFAVYLLTMAGIMFGRASRDSLFFVFFGVEYLPYMYFANAVFFTLSSVIYTALVVKVDRGRFLGGLSLVFAASLLVSWLILPRPKHHWFYPALYIESQVIWSFSLMQFWTFAGEFFNTRQAKRLFPFLVVGGLLGMVGVGVTSKTVVRSLGTANLLLLWAGLILAATVLGGIAFRSYRTVKDPPPLEAIVAPAQQRSEWEKIRNGFDEVRRTPLLRSLAGYVLLLWIVCTVVDFCFSRTVRARYPDPTDLATFLGRFVGVQGFLCLFVQVLFARAVIARLGVGRTINFHPAFLILGTAWMSLRYGYASVVTTKLGDATMTYTFSDSSYQLLYNPIAPDQRARVRGFIEGYIRSLSLAAVGGLLLLGNKYLKPFSLGSREIPAGQQLAWGALALAVVWLGFALKARRGYVGALLRNLQGDSPDLRQAAMNALEKLKDPASLSILMNNLRDDNPVRVVEAVQFLETVGSQGASRVLLDLLGHPDPRVRATAVSALGRRHDAKIAGRLVPLLGDLDNRVRANAVEALGKSQDPSVAEKLRPLLYDPARRVKLNAFVAIANLQGPASVAEWLPMLEELARGDRESRAAATYALSRLHLDASVDILCGLLQSPELPLRCEVARALGRLGSAGAVSCLVDACSGPGSLRHHVRHSLAKIARKSGPEVTRQLADMALSSDRVMIRSELAQVLGRLPQDGGTNVLDTALALLEDPHWRVRWKVLRALERIAHCCSLPESARLALFRYAGEELAGFQQSLRVSQTLLPLRQTDSEKLLAEALEEDRVRIEERVFHVLGILCGRDQMLAIFKKLHSGDARLRADALEALDTLAPREIGQQLLALVEPSPQREAKATISVHSAISGLAHHSKPWIRACAAFYVMDHLQAVQPNGESLLGALAGDSESVVRETALYAGWRAFGGHWEPLSRASAGSPDPTLRGFAQRLSLNRPAERIDTMLLTVEKVLFLKSVPLFQHLDDEDLAAAADVASEQEYAANAVIYSEQQPAHHLYVIARGRVEVLYCVGSSQRQVAVLGEKESFGEMSILDDEPRPRAATVRALESTLVLKIDRASFCELIYEHPEISFAILKMLSRRLRQKDLEAEAAATLGVGPRYG